jgi:GPH family glycoside/pentoside/hexuronide:cation symporter
VQELHDRHLRRAELLFTYFYELTSSQIAVLQLDSLFSAILAASLTGRMSRRFGKKAVCMVFYVGAFIVGITPLVLRHYGLLWDNHSFELVPTLFLQGIVFSFMGMSSTILAQSMIADVAEEVERKTGRRNEGLLFSFGSLISKAISGTGVFGAGLIPAYGLPEKAKPGNSNAMLGRFALYIPVAPGFMQSALLSQQVQDHANARSNLAAPATHRRLPPPTSRH